jgi:hypothetical protein
MDRPPEWANDPGDYDVEELEPLLAEEIPLDPRTLPTWVVEWAKPHLATTERITVQVPSRAECELDGREMFGRSGSHILRHRFGVAAMRVGDPEFPYPELIEPGYAVELSLDKLADTAAETIANVLHVFPRGAVDHQAVLDQALERYRASLRP